MVRTRRGKVQGDQGDQSEQPALQSTRAAKHRRARKSTATATNGISTNGDSVASPIPPVRARRLRSDKNSESPLQTLQEPTRKRPGKTSKETSAVAPKEDDDVYEEEDTGLFFQESFKKTKSELQSQLHSLRDQSQSIQHELDDDEDDTTPLPNLNGEELLERIENEKRQFNSLTPKTDIPGVPDTHSNNATPTNGGDVIEESPATPTPNGNVQHHTPRSTGWGLRSFIDRIIPSVFRSATPLPALVAVPATAPPRPLNSNEIQELNESLVPVDTPTRKPKVKQLRSSSKPKKSKVASSRRIIPSQRAIISRIANNVKPEQKSSAVEWAKKQTETLAAQGSIGEKRKMLDEPIKLKDIKSIPSSLPWQTGSYGLVDDFWDDSDEECDAPEWYKLDQLANAPPPAKRQKIDKENENPVVTPKKKEMSLIKAASRSPIEPPPRPATDPSPMFSNPSTPPTNNIFGQQDFQSSSGRSVGLSFTFPEDFSDEEDERSGTSSGSGSSPWTQAPPPAPAPAHASLPTPLKATPSVPAMSAEAFFPQADPVKDARKEAMKYTPAKPSGLRNVISQSPFQTSGGKQLSNGPVSLFGPTVQAQPSFVPTSSTYGPPVAKLPQMPIPDELLGGDFELKKSIGASVKFIRNETWKKVIRNPYHNFSLGDLLTGDGDLKKHAGSDSKPTSGETWFSEIGNKYTDAAKTAVHV